MKSVAFINENTLGHASYLVPFIQAYRQQPELGIEPHSISATPLPPRLERRANFSIRGLRKWGLDFQNARWRLTVSEHVRQEIELLRTRQRIDAIVINTQSVALSCESLARALPLFVCLDATFEQLAASRWFAPNRLSRWLLPLTLAPIRARERRIFHSAARLLPWSDLARQSLEADYRIPPERMSVLPPSIDPPPMRTARQRGGKPQILFIGGDFQRKGGPLLLKCFAGRFASRAELHLVTQSDVPPQPGVIVHRSVTAQSDAWRQRWEEADVFVFPSTLETFGIVLLEALAFGVPIISTQVGAARELLVEGSAGILLSTADETLLACAIADVLDNRDAARARAEIGRRRVEEKFSLGKNAAQLAGWLSGI
jgi:glycosyltransferase involved in cell wall biosynthesis